MTVTECTSLLEQLRQLPDPRDRRGIRHTLASVLAVAAAAVLAGARSCTAIGEWIADAPAQVQAALEVRRDICDNGRRPPHEATIRRILQSVDADTLDAVLTAWLTTRPQPVALPRRRAIAVDGKALRGARLSDGTTIHLLVLHS
ncbi:transposase family protein [Planomonospora sp. ID82291]|uniref:transposase family protein n=1 Tax=Planomonospora sp. ID82291 TaxID=2738136 RepID=UPI0018C35514|nr:transposase family protein [Planomonospora sp. ID82291]MBG0815713.1 transposase family protein [Planomonospora sp. ID82291]